MVGVDIDVRPIAEVKRRDGDGRGIIVVMIAAFGVGRDVCDEFVASALCASASFDDAVIG